MIGKVIRGANVRRLLYYLYGPGKANEHTDPRLVAGFGDPAELEPDRLDGGRRDFRRLTGLLSQPLAALNGDNHPKPIWHCALRAAPEDRVLSDAEWGRVAAHVMHRVGLAPEGDEVGVRWVAVRHAADHVHIVATLARQDRHRPDLWNSYRKLRQACRDTEEWFGLRRTAAADCTAARRDTRAESEQAIRLGWDEPPRTWLRREVCTTAAGARTEREFFAHLGRDALDDLAVAHGQLGNIYRSAGDTDAALRHYQQTIQYNERQDNRYDAGRARYNAALALATPGGTGKHSSTPRPPSRDFQAVGPGANTDAEDARQLITLLQQRPPDQPSPPS